VLTAEFDKRHLNLIFVGIREVHLPQPLQDALNQKNPGPAGVGAAEVLARAGDGESTTGFHAGNRRGNG